MNLPDIFFYFAQKLRNIFEMKKSGYLFAALAVLILGTSSALSTSKKNEMVEIKTSLGDIKVELYEETPQHKSNMIKLVDEGFYDSLLFHRVIKGFMVQTGDPKSKGAKPGAMLGMGGPGYTVPAEFNSKFIHKKGALSAARLGDQQNPHKASSGSQFYIVQGSVLTDEQLNHIETQRIEGYVVLLVREYLAKDENKAERDSVMRYQMERNIQKLNVIIDEIKAKMPEEIAALDKYKYTEEQREIYKTIGGAPHLDFAYTVFGEVVEGLDVIDKIASVETDRADRPVEDIIMTMKVK